MPKNKHHPKIISISSRIEVSYLGPDIAQGPLPAVFYLALSAEETLGQDPFNQPAVYLSSLPIRIFSLTLPGHGHHLSAKHAMAFWAQQMMSGINCVQECIDQMQETIRVLIDQQILIPTQLCIMGLSRGAFIATHVAAHIPYFHSILGFAPLTKLLAIKEFQHAPSHPLFEQLNVEHLTTKLYHRNIRFYIGNGDTRVGTRNCYEFIEHLSQYAMTQKIRSPQIELIITPSIGHQGHGTSPSVFHQGAQWIAGQLKATHD